MGVSGNVLGTDLPGLIRPIVIIDIPVARVCVGVDSPVEVNRTHHPVPLTVHLQAHGLPHLGPADSDFNVGFEGGKEGSDAKLVLIRVVGEVESVIVCVVGLVGLDDANSVFRRGSRCLKVVVIVGVGERFRAD